MGDCATSPDMLGLFIRSGIHNVFVPSGQQLDEGERIVVVLVEQLKNSSDQIGSSTNLTG